MSNRTSVERVSDREVVITRLVSAPARIVFEAWTRAELFRQWWVPKSAPMALVSCEMDVRVGGGYRLVFKYQGSEMAFFGTYREVAPDSRLVWTNDEAGEAGQVSTVTFEEKAGKTFVVLHELYPSKEALDDAIASGSAEGTAESFEQMEEFVSAMKSARGSLKGIGTDVPREPDRL
jgi:uncharacterized protein YndB with AHSA1/START domain